MPDNRDKEQATSNRDKNSGQKIDKDLVSGTYAQSVGREGSKVDAAYDDSLRPGQPGYDADRDSRITGGIRNNDRNDTRDSRDNRSGNTGSSNINTGDAGGRNSTDKDLITGTYAGQVGHNKGGSNQNR